MTTQTQKQNKATENAIRLIRKEITQLYVCGEHYPHYADKLAKWSAGFTVAELPNAKPSTIREATSNRDYVYYLAFLLTADATGKNYRRLNGGGWFEVGLYLTATSNGNAKGLSFNRDKHIKNVWRNTDAEVLKNRKKEELQTRNNNAERLEALKIIANCEKYYNDITFADIMENPKSEQFKDELTKVALHAKKFITKIDTFASVADMLARFNEIKSECNNIIYLLKHRELIINNNFREVSSLKVIDNQIVDKYADDTDDFWAERYIMRYDLEKGEILKGVSHYE